MFSIFLHVREMLLLFQLLRCCGTDNLDHLSSVTVTHFKVHLDLHWKWRRFRQTSR